MLRATHGHLASKNENKRQKSIGRWFEVMTVGTTDKVALYWYAEPSVLTHRFDRVQYGNIYSDRNQLILKFGDRITLFSL